LAPRKEAEPEGEIEDSVSFAFQLV
jgi:hypothetical protein